MDYLMELALLEQEDSFREYLQMIEDAEFEQMIEYYEKEASLKCKTY